MFAIRHGDVLINQVLGSPVEGGIGNVYLRRRYLHVAIGVLALPVITGSTATQAFGAGRSGSCRPSCSQSRRFDPPAPSPPAR